MLRVVADIECDGLLPQASVIHCLCAQVLETDEIFAFADHPGYQPISLGLELLSAADVVIGHQFRDFDAQVIKRVKHVDLGADKILDTLDLSRCLIDIAGLSALDEELYAQGRMPLDYVRRHSLASWGYRLGRPKNPFGQTADWRLFCDAMVAYCVDDVLLNADLYRLFEAMV